MSNVIEILNNSTLINEITTDTDRSEVNEAINYLRSMWSNSTENEPQLTFDDDILEAISDSRNEATTDIDFEKVDTFGPAVRERLRKMICKIDINEIINKAAENMPDEKTVKFLRSEIVPSKNRKSSTAFAGISSSTSRRGTNAKNNLDTEVKIKHSPTNHHPTEKPSLNETGRKTGSNVEAVTVRRNSTKSEKLKGTVPKNERLARAREGVLQQQSFRMGSARRQKHDNGSDNEQTPRAKFVLSPPSTWSSPLVPSIDANQTWQTRENIYQKVSSWLAEQTERNNSIS